MYVPSHEPLNRGQNFARTTEKTAVEKVPANSPITSGPLEFPEIDRSTDRQLLVAVQDVCKLLSKDLLETMQPPASQPEVQWHEWRS